LIGSLRRWDARVDFFTANSHVLFDDGLDDSVAKIGIFPPEVGHLAIEESENPAQVHHYFPLLRGLGYRERHFYPGRLQCEEFPVLAPSHGLSGDSRSGGCDASGSYGARLFNFAHFEFSLGLRTIIAAWSVVLFRRQHDFAGRV
jgi:hypothetical protein